MRRSVLEDTGTQYHSAGEENHPDADTKYETCSDDLYKYRLPTFGGNTDRLYSICYGTLQLFDDDLEQQLIIDTKRQFPSDSEQQFSSDSEQQPAGDSEQLFAVSEERIPVVSSCTWQLVPLRSLTQYNGFIGEVAEKFQIESSDLPEFCRQLSEYFPELRQVLVPLSKGSSQLKAFREYMREISRVTEVSLTPDL